VSWNVRVQTNRLTRLGQVETQNNDQKLFHFRPEFVLCCKCLSRFDARYKWHLLLDNVFS
jgi:hypothetical protein